MSKIRVGIVGVGNCASALIQGVEFYAQARSDERVPGLMHVDVGPYHVSMPTKSGSISPMRSGPSRTTRSSFPTFPKLG